jgi:hypothetical protein
MTEGTVEWSKFSKGARPELGWWEHAPNGVFIDSRTP